MKKTDVVLSIDPGKDSYAWAYVTREGVVLDTGMILNTVDDVRYMKFLMVFPRYVREITALFKRNDVRIVSICAERYTPRPGAGAGANAEFVNLMLGALFVVGRVNRIYDVVPVMPSTWKGWLGRLATGVAKIDSSSAIFGFPQVVKNEKKSDNFAIKEHQMDAIGIGLWWSCNHELFRLEPERQKKMLSNCIKSVKSIWKERSNGIRV